MIKNIMLIVFIVLCKYESRAWQCISDSRTIAELLCCGKPGTIFTCKIINEIPPVYTARKIDTNQKTRIRLGGGDKISDRNEFNRFQYYAKIIKVYFGKLDSSVVKLVSMNGFELNSDYLIYTSGNGIEFYAGAPCDLRTKRITCENKILKEIEIINEVSNIIQKRKTRNLRLRNTNNQLIFQGKFKKGQPKGTLKFYDENSVIYFTKNYTTNYEKRFYPNGIKQQEKYYLRDTLVYCAYLNDSSNCISIIQKDIPYRTRGNEQWYFETYENCHLKQIHYQENGIGFIGDYFEYFPNGNIKLKGKYISGQKFGIWLEFDEQNNIINRSEYN